MVRAIALASLALLAVAATPQVQTAEIHGRVIEAATRQPVRGAVVSIGGPETPGSSPRRLLTGIDGRFILRNVRPGSVALSVTKHGYIPGSSGRRRPNGVGVPLVIEPGDRLTGVELLMWPMATISGVVTDDLGEPVPGMQVTVARPSPNRPVSPSRDLAFAFSRGTRTDDAGRYSLALPAGEYIVGVSMSDSGSLSPLGLQISGRQPFESYAAEIELLGPLAPAIRSLPPYVIVGGARFSYVGTFYGGVGDAALSTPVELRDSEERTGVDLRLELRPAVRIAGMVTDEAGPVNDALVSLSAGPVERAVRSKPDGTFLFQDLPAGTYAITARRSQRPTATVLAGASLGLMPAVVANRDVDNLTMRLGRGARISGTLILPPGIETANVGLQLQRAPGGPGVSAVVSRGTFAVPGVEPGRYILRVAPGSGDYMLDSVELDGRNVIDFPFEVGASDVNGLVVHVTNRPAVLSGSVQRPDGKPSTTAAIVLFPTDASTWNAPLLTRTMQFVTKRVSGGGYYLENIPRGEYYLAAVDDALLHDWYNRPLLLKLMANAVRITVTPGAQLTRDLIIDER